MFRQGNLQAVGEPIGPGLGSPAVLVAPQPADGFYVIAGTLHSTTTQMAPRELQRGDFYTSERVSFARWADALEYFQDTPFAPLLASIDERIRGYPDLKLPD